MKTRHNKKRNTAFVFEALVREATVAIIKEDHAVKDKALALIKKHFAPGSLLYKDLQNYRSLYEKQNLPRKTAEKIVKEARLAGRLLDTQGLFVSQSELIADVNQELTPEVFNNFVPNYKDLATVFQIFHPKTRAKERVLLESQVVEKMLSEEERKKEFLKPIDNLTYRSFVKAFNEKYNDALLKEQKDLLKVYINSFSDNGIDLKIFLNEEIPRLQQAVEDIFTKY